MKKNEHIPFYFITGTNRVAPPEIRATFEFASPEIVGQKNGIVVWRLRRKPAQPDGDGNGGDGDGEASVPAD